MYNMHVYTGLVLVFLLKIKQTRKHTKVVSDVWIKVILMDMIQSSLICVQSSLEVFTVATIKITT